MSDGNALFIFSGLPGSGKTTLARAAARRIGGAYIRIDTIEQALRNLCAVDVAAEGYRLAYRVASDNLRAGLSVVATRAIRSRSLDANGNASRWTLAYRM